MADGLEKLPVIRRTPSKAAWTALRAAALLLMGSALTPALAQTPLAQAVLIASEYDPGINALRHEISRRSIEIQTAREERYPQVSLSADTATTSSDGPGVTLTVSQVIYDWGRVQGMISSASQDRVIAVAELKDGTEKLTLEVATYFIDIEVLDRKIQRTAEYLGFAERIASHADARNSAGRGDNGEVARAQLEVARTQERLSQLQSDRMLSMAQLEFLMGRQPGTLASPPDLNFHTRYAARAETQSAVRLAPDYIVAQAQLARADAEIDLAKAARLPTIKLQAQLRSDLDRGNTRSSVGLSTGVDLGAGSVTGRRVQSAQMQAEAAKSNLLAIERNLSNGVMSARETIRALSTSEASQAGQLSQAQAVLDTYEGQFVGGQRELIDLLTTGRDLYDAQIDEIDTYDERKRTEYEAAFDLGVLGTLILSNTKRG